MRTCSKCQAEKDVECFSWKTQKNRHSWCKECRAKYRRSKYVSKKKLIKELPNAAKRIVDRLKEQGVDVSGFKLPDQEVLK